MEFLISLIIIAAMGYWCYTIAKKNGRNTTLAVFMGIFFVIWAVIVYYLLGKTDELWKKEIEVLKKSNKKEK